MFLWLGNWENKLQWATYTIDLSSFLNLWIFVCVHIIMNSLSQLTFLKYFCESLQQKISGLTLFSSGLLKILETQHKPHDLFLFFDLARTIFKIWLLNCSTFLFQNSKFVAFWKKCFIIPCHFKKKSQGKILFYIYFWGMSVTIRVFVLLSVIHMAVNWSAKIEMQNRQKIVTLSVFKCLNKYLWTLFPCLICSSIYFLPFIAWLPNKIRFIILLCQSSIILNYLLAYWPVSVKLNCGMEFSNALIFNHFWEKRHRGRAAWPFHVSGEEQLATWAVFHWQIGENLNNGSLIPNGL